MQIYRCTTSQMYNSKNVQLIDLRVYNYSDAYLYRCNKTYTDSATVQMYNSTGVQLYKCTTLQVYNFTSVQLYKCTTLQVYNFTNVQLYRCTTFQMQSPTGVAYILCKFKSLTVVHFRRCTTLTGLQL